MDISSGEISFMVFRRVSRADAGEFSLDGQMLNVLMELDGRKSLVVVAKNTALSMGVIRRVVSKLIELNLVEPVEEAVSVLGNDFFDYLNEQLSLATGPIADVLIEDAVDDMGFAPGRIPRHRAAELIDILARQIPREEKRIAFQQAMIEKIRGL
ncbi:MAG: hypothetical protein J7M30_02450 [Deltaproteobacteria bacterium]|nr:hypothetical protein [Deltaproteobacteria bacterium]